MKSFLLAIIMTLLALMSIRSWAVTVQFPDGQTIVRQINLSRQAHVRKRIKKKKHQKASVRGSFGILLSQKKQNNLFEHALGCNIDIIDVSAQSSNKNMHVTDDSPNDRNEVMHKVLTALSELNSLLKQACIQKVVKLEDEYHEDVSEIGHQEDLTNDAVDYYQTRLDNRERENKFTYIETDEFQSSRNKQKKQRKQSHYTNQCSNQYVSQPQQATMSIVQPMSYGYPPMMQPIMVAPQPMYGMYQAQPMQTFDQISRLVDEKLAEKQKVSNNEEFQDTTVAMNLDITELSEFVSDDSVPFTKKEKKLYKILSRIIAHKGMGDLITQQVQSLLDQEVRIVSCLLAYRPSGEVEQIVDERDAIFKKSLSSAQQIYNVVLDLATSNDQFKQRLNCFAHAKNRSLKKSKPLRNALTKKERRIFLESMKSTLERYQDFIYSRYIKLSINN